MQAQKYKQTNIPWIGEVPEDWELKRLKFIFKLRSGEGNPTIDPEGIYNVYGSNGVIGRTNQTNLNQKSILIGRVGASGYINYSDENCWVTDNVLITEFINPINQGFFFYLLKSADLGRLSVSNAQPLITGTMIKEEYSPLPPLPTQTAIATFLDQKTTEIKKLVENKRKLIELLKEQKQSIIHRAVTKGIDPNVKMKESGISWIGEIPENWKITPLKMTIEKIIDNRGKTPPITDFGYPLLEVNSISLESKTPIYDNVQKFVSEETYANWFRSGHLDVNDIIVPTVGSIGSANICKERKGSIAQNIIGMRIKNGYNPDYIYYVLISPGMQDKVISLNISGIQPSVKVPHLINLQIPTPSIQEQERIVNIIEKETSQIGSAIEKIEKEIILIEEYQISLIYQAVTGKIQIT